LERTDVDVSALALEVLARLRDQSPGREVRVSVQPGLRADADLQLLRVVLENLLGNAWKFTGKRQGASITVGREGPALFVRDDGAGFDPTFAARLFQPFQRLHKAEEFEGTGIGLATVARVVVRHGGRIWAESRPGAGATFFFTLSPAAAFHEGAPRAGAAS
jgi:signal transduction histidine kinase